MRFLSFIVQSKLWVALASAAMMIESSYILCDGFFPFSVVHCFFLTMAAYLFLDQTPFKGRRVFIYFAATGMVLGFMVIPKINWLALLPGMLIILFYQTSWMKEYGLRQLAEWRKIPFLKNLVIAICWMLLTTTNATTDLIEPDRDYLFWYAGGLFFIMALSMAEDLIDHEADDFITGLKITGILRFRMVASLFLVISGVAYLMMDHVHLFAVIMVFAAVPMLWWVRPERSRILQSFVIDGWILSKALIVAIVYHYT